MSKEGKIIREKYKTWKLKIPERKPISSWMTLSSFSWCCKQLTHPGWGLKRLTALKIIDTELENVLHGLEDDNNHLNSPDSCDPSARRTASLSTVDRAGAIDTNTRNTSERKFKIKKP